MIVKFCALLLCTLLAYSIGQFHQSSYDIVHDRIEIAHYNRSAVVDPQITVFKYNETLRMKAINGSAYFTPGVHKNIMINFALYKFTSNAYRPFPVNITLDICDEYKKNAFGMQAAIQSSNFRGCPCPVGLYYMYNFVLDQDRFPPHIPLGKYKLAIHVRIDDRIYLLRGNWYGSVSARGKE